MMIKMTFQDSLGKRKLTASALISAALHIAAVAVLFSKPLYLNSKFFSQIGKAPSTFLEEENIVILKRNQALEEALSYFETSPLGAPLTYSKTLTLNELESGFESVPTLPPIALSIPHLEEPPLPALPIPTFEEQSVVLVETPATQLRALELMTPKMELPPVAGSIIDYEVPVPLAPLTVDTPVAFDFIPSEEIALISPYIVPEIPTPDALDEMNPSLAPPALCEPPTIPFAGTYADFAISPTNPKSITGIRGGASLGEYGLPTLELREWNEFFDVDVKTFAKEEGGYLFSVSIIPKVDLSEYRLKQNYLFVIDRSTSVDKSRFQTAKRGIARAVAALRPGDFFNILILDGTVTQLSASPLAVSKGTLQKAEEFLNQQSHAYQGAAMDVYSTLTKILTSQIETHDATAAILISDGDSPLKPTQQRKKINNWLEANRDRVTLYTATAGQGNNLSSLKMLSLASRGSFLYSDTHAAFPRKLAKLVMDLRYPIAKEMNLSVISPEDGTQVEILPPSQRLPNLFSDHPYMLIGSASKLTDFTLLLEGKNKDQIFKIKKTISLSKGKPGSRLLQKQWAAEKAHTLFDQYLREGEATYLKEAETILTSPNQKRQ